MKAKRSGVEFGYDIGRKRRAGQSGPCARERRPLGSTANGGTPSQLGVKAISRRGQQRGDRPRVVDRAHLRALYPEVSTMKKRRKDSEREDRIHNEAIVDAYGPEEQAMGWHHYLANKLSFPFQARSIASKVVSPLCKGETVEVRRMAPEEACSHDILVLIRWQGRNSAVPLSQLTPTDVDETTAEAVSDWHYWAAHGYLF